MSQPIHLQLARPPEAFRLPDRQGGEYLPAAYRSVDSAARGRLATQQPRNVFIEVTNRCNLLCETCPRTFATYEEPRTLSWENFLRIVEQFPALERAVLHGIGEPLLNRDLPRMIAHLKARRVTVLFNTNATLLNGEWARKLIEAGLDELRVSVDGADPKTYALIRGVPLFHKVVSNLARFVEIQREMGATTPRPSLWMTGMVENISELPEVVRLAARIGVPEVYLQRMVYRANDDGAPGMLNAGHGLYGTFDAELDRVLSESEALAQTLGVSLRASGATTPRRSLGGPQGGDAAGAAAPQEGYTSGRGGPPEGVSMVGTPRPWAACMRPWTTAYITANGNALPCCIAPFATSDYDSLTLGNVFEQPFGDLWNAERYQAWREQLLGDQPHEACRGCGVYWSL
jgi:radical SAM protein with 4Fe4S-binding SPASM domain